MCISHAVVQRLRFAQLKCKPIGGSFRCFCWAGNDGDFCSLATTMTASNWRNGAEILEFEVDGEFIQRPLPIFDSRHGKDIMSKGLFGYEDSSPRTACR